MCVRAGPVTPNTDDIGARKGTRGHVARDDAAAREVSLTAHGAYGARVEPSTVSSSYGVGAFARRDAGVGTTWGEVGVT